MIAIRKLYKQIMEAYRLRALLEIINWRLEGYGSFRLITRRHTFSFVRESTGEEIQMGNIPADLLNRLVRRDRAVKAILEEQLAACEADLGNWRVLSCNWWARWLASRHRKRHKLQAAFHENGEWTITVPGHMDSAIWEMEARAEVLHLNRICAESGNPKLTADNYAWFYLPIRDFELRPGSELRVERRSAPLPKISVREYALCVLPAMAAYATLFAGLSFLTDLDLIRKELGSIPEWVLFSAVVLISTSGAIAVMLYSDRLARLFFKDNNEKRGGK